MSPSPLNNSTTLGLPSDGDVDVFDPDRARLIANHNELDQECDELAFALAHEVPAQDPAAREQLEAGFKKLEELEVAVKQLAAQISGSM